LSGNLAQLLFKSGFFLPVVTAADGSGKEKGKQAQPGEQASSEETPIHDKGSSLAGFTGYNDVYLLTLHGYVVLAIIGSWAAQIRLGHRFLV
jgi:hypothetical protein